MAERSITFDCYFDVIGRLSTHSNQCFFDVVSESDYDLILHTNNTEIKNPKQIDFSRYSAHSLQGVLNNGDKTFVNAKIEFVKQNEISSTFGNVVSEVCYTDNGGKYNAFIEPGIYNIDIFINNQKITKRNIEIQQGLKFQYYKTVKGLIHHKYADVVCFCGCDYKMVYGQLIDNKKTPINNAEIIILKDNKLDTYVKTDDDGNYSFAIKNGAYTVKIRSKYSPMKSTEITIDDVNGFSEQLTSNSILFNKKQTIRL